MNKTESVGRGGLGEGAGGEFGMLEVWVPWRNTSGHSTEEGAPRRCSFRRLAHGLQLTQSRLLVDNSGFRNLRLYSELRKRSLRSTLKGSLERGPAACGTRRVCGGRHVSHHPCLPFAVEQVANVVLYSSDYYVKPVAVEEAQ